VLIRHENELVLRMFGDHGRDEHAGEAAIAAAVGPCASVNPDAHRYS
jgi:hypothetical protein